MRLQFKWSRYNEGVATNMIYQYTTLQALACILKNKTIRLNNLLNVDDPEEVETIDFNNFGRHIYVSCWTTESKESIPMWCQYANNMTGVRIGVDESLIETLEKIELREFHYEKKNIDRQAYFGPVSIIPIEYVKKDDTPHLKPLLLHKYSDKTIIELDPLGRYKNDYWEFQKEVRIWMSILPFVEGLKTDEQWFEYLEDCKPIGAYFDLPVNDDLLSSMEILCGPKMSIGDYWLLESVVEKYNKDIKIEKSTIRIK